MNIGLSVKKQPLTEIDEKEAKRRRKIQFAWDCEDVCFIGPVAVKPVRKKARSRK